MQTLRFNPFNQIHKGLRTLLYETAMLLQHTDFSNEDEINVAVKQVKTVNALFEHHAHVEDSRIFPLIESHAPQIVADFEAQHQTDHELSAGLERAMALFTETNSAEQNRWAGNDLLQGFNSFLAFNVEHMKKEETIVNGVLWKYFTDAELQKKVQEISASMPPEQSKEVAYWMLKGLSTQEIIDWYNSVKHTAPPPVFNLLCELAEEALPQKKWEQVKEALQEGALLA